MDKPFEQLIDSLENKLTNLVATHKKVQEDYELLQNKFNAEITDKQQLIDEIKSLKHQNGLLKNANALLGSDEYKRETKLKINALIKEIDQCITQLS